MHRWLVIPWWFLVAVTSVIPLKRAWTFLRQKRLPRPGFCPNCGYDLRATPTRCPECGLEIRPAHYPDV